MRSESNSAALILRPRRGVQLRRYLLAWFSLRRWFKNEKNLTLKNVQIDSPIRNGAIWVTFNETANGNRRFPLPIIHKSTSSTPFYAHSDCLRCLCGILVESQSLFNGAAEFLYLPINGIVLQR